MTELSQATAVLKTSDVQLLTEIGFLACGAGNTSAAKKIFEGLRLGRAERSSALIGLAMSYMESGSLEEAVALLRSGYKDVPPVDYDYRAFFGLCLFASGHRHEAERELRRLLRDGDPQCAAYRLADSLFKKYFTDHRVVSLTAQLIKTVSSDSLSNTR